MENRKTINVFDFDALPSFAKVAPPLRQFKARDGADLSYRFYDSSIKDTVIILLHGSSAHGEYLHSFAEYLSSKVGPVYVPNLRGHYGSGPSRGDCDYIGQLEDDLDDLIEHFHLRDKKIYLVGHSSGGGLAIRAAGGKYGELIQGLVLLSPAIPTAPTMRAGTAGGWAQVAYFKVIILSILNLLSIRCLNHVRVIRFNRPKQYCDGTETLSYSFNLNSSYHPRIPYQKDIQALRNRCLVLIGSEDEANDPLKYQEVMPGEPIHIIPGVKHLDIVCNPEAMEAAANWIASKNNPNDRAMGKYL